MTFWLLVFVFVFFDPSPGGLYKTQEACMAQVRAFKAADNPDQVTPQRYCVPVQIPR